MSFQIKNMWFTFTTMALCIAGCVDEDIDAQLEAELLMDEDLDEEELALLADLIEAEEAALGEAVDDIALPPLELSQKPRMRAPFPSGKTYQCTQGPSGGTSHNAASTLYALDFDTPNAGAAESVVAALAGQVAYVVSGCVVGSTSCGGGFGNHVRINHGGNYFSIYAHLSSVSVAVGTKVGRGQLIGYEGNTGNSTGDHLHFSLHQGDATQVAMAPSVSYFVRDRDATINGLYEDRAASNHVCSLNTGHNYTSDNVCTSVYNSTGTAKAITNNTAYLGETCSVGDVDYFSFGGKAGPFASSVTSTTESIADCSCAILNAQGVELPLGGAEGYTRNDNYNGSEGCSCSLTNATSATHYLKIYAQMPGGYVLNKTLPP